VAGSDRSFACLSDPVRNTDWPLLKFISRNGIAAPPIPELQAPFVTLARLRQPQYHSVFFYLQVVVASFVSLYFPLTTRARG
jgi:hypothetical protein